jgi:Family of unknown function (DUF6496)
VRVIVSASSLIFARISSGERSRRHSVASRYSKSSRAKVARAMRKRKRGILRSGRSRKKVKSRKQAIAIGLAEARREGGRVPRRTGRRRKKKSARSRSS